jgi:hypothetical protein
MKKFNDPTKVAGLVVASIIVVAGLVLATVNRESSPPLLISFVEDASLSTPSAQPCLNRFVNAAVAQPRDEIEVRYIQTGNAATAFEPLQPVEPLKIKKDDIAWSAGPSKLRTLADEFLAKIPAFTPERRTERSPLFITVERAVADLKTRDDARRIVVVSCDLEDTTIPALVAAFKQSPGAKLSGLPRIDNQGVHVRFVSIQSTIGEQEGSARRFTAPRDPNRIKRLQEVWAACFTDPELVSFSPTCNDPLP